MKNTVLLFVLALPFLTCWAQDSGELTLRDAVLKQNTELSPSKLKHLRWVPGSSKVSYITNENGAEALVSQPCDQNTHSVLLTLAELNSLLAEEKPLKAFVPYEWLDAKSIFINAGLNFYAIDVAAKTTKKMFSLPEGAEHITFNDQKTNCSYILEHNLHVRKLDHTDIKLTKDGKPGIVYGQIVHRNEFGIDKGMFWSPDGSKLAFYRMDETMVDDYPLVDISTTPASLHNIKYPMAGKTSHYVQVGVSDLGGPSVVYMNTDGPKDQYLTSVAWTPDSKSLFIGLLNRDQNHMVMNCYNTRSGFLVKPLFEEKDEKYVEPEHAPWFVPNSSEFLWLSERDGYQHLYLYDMEGNLKKQVTSGRWEVHDILGLDPTGNFLFVQGTGEITTDGRFVNEKHNGTQRFVYIVDFKLAGHKLLDSTLGTHSAVLNDDGSYMFHHFSSIETPLVTDVYAATGARINTLYTAENPLGPYRAGSVELVEIPAEDGKTLYGRLVKPSHFDPSKKYPVLLYVYGGPHLQLIKDTYLGAAPTWMLWFAEKGYIVATVDNRGTSARGLEFEQTVFRKLGEAEMADQIAFVNYLQGLPYTHKERFAIHGWSYGGFMTLNMMLTFPGLFQAGVAGGPVCDWKFYEVMYTERYMDTPQANPEGYQRTSVLEKAKNLEDDLLVIHGTADDVVVWQQSQAFLKACIDAGKQLDYFVYPGHLHNVHGVDRVHLMEKVLTFIDDRIGEQSTH